MNLCLFTNIFLACCTRTYVYTLCIKGMFDACISYFRRIQSGYHYRYGRAAKFERIGCLLSAAFNTAQNEIRMVIALSVVGRMCLLHIQGSICALVSSQHSRFHAIRVRNISLAKYYVCQPRKLHIINHHKNHYNKSSSKRPEMKRTFLVRFT